MLVIDVVDHHHRRAGAGGQAFFLTLEEDAAVADAVAQLDAEPFFDVRHQFFAAAQQAGDIGADADVMPAARMRLDIE
jgi:hypothetical protein